MDKNMQLVMSHEPLTVGVHLFDKQGSKTMESKVTLYRKDLRAIHRHTKIMDRTIIKSLKNRGK